MDLLSNNFELEELGGNFDFNQVNESQDEIDTIKKKNEWVIKMRLKFCPLDMIHEDGSLNQEYFYINNLININFINLINDRYFKPVTKQKQKVWTERERKKLIKGIERYGIGNWDEISQHFLPEWACIIIS